MNLREKHGWAYGAGGGFGYRPDGSLLTLQANVRADATGPAITEIFKEMAVIRDQPVSNEELQREREGAILSLPARWSSGRSIANTFQTLLYFGLPLDWYGGYTSRTQALSAPALQKAAQSHVKPGDAVVLVVGDPAKVRGQLDALLADGPLKGGSLVRLDADGKIIP
jgi:zinc protease